MFDREAFDLTFFHSRLAVRSTLAGWIASAK
jgi:hypothetical protein